MWQDYLTFLFTESRTFPHCGDISDVRLNCATWPTTTFVKGRLPRRFAPRKDEIPSSRALLRLCSRSRVQRPAFHFLNGWPWKYKQVIVGRLTQKPLFAEKFSKSGGNFTLLLVSYKCNPYFIAKYAQKWEYKITELTFGSASVTCRNAKRSLKRVFLAVAIRKTICLNRTYVL
jgi:hypothetical protein